MSVGVLMHGILAAIGTWFLYEVAGEMIGELLMGILEASSKPSAHATTGRIS